jgi:hypothetical protein
MTTVCKNALRKIASIKKEADGKQMLARMYRALINPSQYKKTIQAFAPKFAPSTKNSDVFTVVPTNMSNFARYSNAANTRKELMSLWNREKEALNGIDSGIMSIVESGGQVPAPGARDRIVEDLGNSLKDLKRETPETLYPYLTPEFMRRNVFGDAWKYSSLLADIYRNLQEQKR